MNWCELMWTDVKYPFSCPFYSHLGSTHWCEISILLSPGFYSHLGSTHITKGKHFWTPGFNTGVQNILCCFELNNISEQQYWYGFALELSQCCWCFFSFWMDLVVRNCRSFKKEPLSQSCFMHTLDLMLMTWTCFEISVLMQPQHLLSH